ncbi:MAG: aspartate/glutamate racemase family protein, partial [Vicinamibacterales bacterium]
ESTIDYYRAMIAAYRERQPDSYPAIVITSVDVNAMLGALMQNQLAAVTEQLVAEVERLEAAGVACAAIAANSPHIVFDEVQRRSRLPLVSIVEATALEAMRLRRKRLALFGTRFTMQGRFYQRAFEPGGLAVVLPDEAEQAYIHDKYMTELVRGTLNPETRDGLLEIVAQMKARDGIDAVILGGTELPLILRDATASDIPLLDTTVIHARAIVARAMLSTWR